ncbi:TPA: hypothetical protein ACQRI9_001353 [Pseudomonas aeruginosa]|uniref:hypothetical protein n=1 Tax=Pseudomonas aeruginosa TaxID=287 RepID=UPI001072A6A5|nr:hypothetical protein [Pseudomonas aeruginosa]EIU3799857.1 hypothetical protein [Pseudomonas aeruginosa]EIW4151616.1 hypothetical protein [Pseudomonas aeruginosa]EIY9711335.1 hypothetical protein [Pseudomonas aeruginosa]EKB9381885.1 hypothetical protein [Pseudomonas aeruginosa]EKU5858194.1 hypothetical protein [Pseudomonas aeruginosa]
MRSHHVVVVNNAWLRLVSMDGRSWLKISDLHRALECSRKTVYLHSKNVSIRRVVKFGAGFIDESGVRHICTSTMAAGARAVLKWIDDGGMNQPFDEFAGEPLSLEAFNAFASSSKAKNRAYCRRLCGALLRHSDGAGVRRLVSFIEGEVSALVILGSCKELNDARHDLFRRFYLQGGEK